MNDHGTELDPAESVGATVSDGAAEFWSVGVWCPAAEDVRRGTAVRSVSHQQPDHDPLRDIERRVADLSAAGLGDLRLFVHPQTIIPASCSHVPVTVVSKRLNDAAVLRFLIAEVFMRRPGAGGVLLLSARSDTAGIAAWNHTVADRLSGSSAPGLFIDAESASGLHALGNAAIRDLLEDAEGLASIDSVEDGFAALLNWAERAGTMVEILPRIARSSQHIENESAEARETDRTTSPLTPDGSLRVAGSAVSIVVPTWNCAEYLPACLHSLLRQTVAAEIIVVDDASSDGTSGVLDAFADRLTVVHHDLRRGANAARNTGMAAATGELIAFADADNEYAPRWIERLLQSLLADPTAALAYCGYFKQSPSGERLENRAAEWDLETLWFGNYIDMSSLVRRSAIPQGGLVEGFRPFDDWRLWLQLARAGWHGTWISEQLFVKHVRDSGKTEQSLAAPHRRGRDISHLRREYADLVGLEGPLSVVIPASGCEDLTARCLQHLGDYCGVPFAVVYVDNGSPVEVLDVVAEAAEVADVTLQIIRNRENIGFTRAVNQGIAASAAADVLLLNNDCFIGPGCVENLARELRHDKRVAAAGPLTGDKGQQSLREKHWQEVLGFPPEGLGDLDDPVRMSFRLSHKLRSVSRPVLAFFCTLLRGEALQRYGPLDEQFTSGLAADDEWCLRVGRHGREVRVVLNAYAAHLHRASFERLQIDRDLLQRDAQQRLHKMLASHPIAES